MPASFSPGRVAVGYDIRESSPGLARALKRGLTESGVDVLDIGLCGTEGSYFATSEWQLDGGIMVTASHNPPDYNGMKFVREERPSDQRRHRAEGYPGRHRCGQFAAACGQARH